MTPEQHNLSAPVQEITHQNKQRLGAAVIAGIISIVLLFAVVGAVVQRAVDQSNSAHALAHAIVAQRYELCLEQNRRHDRSLGYILTLARKQEAESPKLRHQIQQQIGEYRILFQYLQPKQNCRKFKL